MSDHTPTDPHELEIWTYLKAHPRITYAEVAANSSLSKAKRSNYLSKLRRLGLLKPCGREGTTQFFSMFSSRDVLERSTQKLATPEAEIWQVMRILGTFSPPDLSAALMASTIQISDRFIQEYCSVLMRANYLRVLAEARLGTSPARYRLVKNTGPLPPERRRIHVLIDPNKDEIVYSKGVRV